MGGLSTSPGSARLLRKKAGVLGRQPSVFLSDGFVTDDLLSAVGGFARWLGLPAWDVALYVPPALQAAELVLEALRASDFTRSGVRNALFRIRSRGSVYGPFRISATGNPMPVTFGSYRPRGGRWDLSGVIRLP